MLRGNWSSMITNATNRRGCSIGLGAANELVIGGYEAFGVGHRLDSGRSRPWVDQAHLTEDVTGLQGPDTLGKGTFAYAHLDRTRNHEKCGIAGLAFGED